MCVSILDLFAITSGKKISYINSLEIFLKKEKLQKVKRRHILMGIFLKFNNINLCRILNHNTQVHVI